VAKVARRVEITQEALVVHLRDGRVLAFAFRMLPALDRASFVQRYQWRISDDGERLEWQGLELSLRVDELLARAAAELADK
jgi:hypothetical protein